MSRLRSVSRSGNGLTGAPAAPAGLRDGRLLLPGGARPSMPLSVGSVDVGVNVGIGAGAGALAALTSAALLAAVGGAPAVGALAATDSSALGLTIHLLLGAAMGIVNARWFATGRGAGAVEGVMCGVALAIFWWLLLPVSLLPVLMGRGPQWHAGAVAAALPVLVGYVAQGALVGLAGYLLYRAYRGAVRGSALPDGPPMAAPGRAPPAPVRHKIVILGGGFAGVTTAQHLEREFADDEGVAITLVSSANHLLFTPMLSEVTAGGVEAQHIGPPLRAFFRRVDVVQGDAESVDFDARVVRLAGSQDYRPATGPRGGTDQAGSGALAASHADRVAVGAQGPESPAGETESALPFDHLVLALGAVPSFFGNQAIREHAFTFKSLGDAILLRNHVIDMLERADAEPDPARRRTLLTFVVAGGGFAGAELIGGLNDFVRGSLWYYPNVSPEDVALVLVHAGERILPELSAELAEYARQKMGARGVTFKLGVRLADAGPGAVVLSNGETIATRTLVWTAGNTPHPLLRDLGVELDRRGAVTTDATLAVPHPTFQGRLWAVGDCAAIPNAATGTTAPPTAQHALREAKTLAHNIHAAICGKPLKPFRFRAVGALAVLGHQTACAEIYGLKFSGLLAWWLWRMIYLGKLPTLEKRVRVALDWAVDLFFPRDIARVHVPADARPGNSEVAGAAPAPSGSGNLAPVV